MAACSRPQRGDLYTEHQLTSTSRIPAENMLPSVNPLQSFQHPLQTIHDHDQHPGHERPAIGRPIHFTTGQFTGYTIRMELDEVQKADLGRKWEPLIVLRQCLTSARGLGMLGWTVGHSTRHLSSTSEYSRYNMLVQQRSVRRSSSTSEYDLPSLFTSPKQFFFPPCLSEFHWLTLCFLS